MLSIVLVRAESGFSLLVMTEPPNLSNSMVVYDNEGVKK